MTNWHRSTTEYWNGQSVMVTGGVGFLGSHLVRELERRRDNVDVFIPRSDEYDFRNREEIQTALEASNPDVVIHLAARVREIGANHQNPGKYFYENAVMVIELIEQARHYGVKKFTILGTICAYPKHTPVPFNEENLFEGYPEETNAPYGIAKKTLLTQSKAYRKRYDFNSIYLMPVNLYGPRDDFDLATSHVIPAIVRKFIEARDHGEKSITAWGTGEPTREFLHIQDAADGTLTATERYDESEPVNLGSRMEISIQELVEVIAELTGYERPVKGDTSKPDGQPRRRLDTSRVHEQFSWQATTEFEEGLKRTVEWYKNNRTGLLMGGDKERAAGLSLTC